MVETCFGYRMCSSHPWEYNESCPLFSKSLHDWFFFLCVVTVATFATKLLEPKLKMDWELWTVLLCYSVAMLLCYWIIARLEGSGAQTVSPKSRNHSAEGLDNLPALFWTMTMMMMTRMMKKMMVTQHNTTSQIPARWDSDIMMKRGNMM